MPNENLKTVASQVVNEMRAAHASGKSIIVLRSNSKSDILACICAFVNSMSFKPKRPLQPQDLITSLGWCSYSYASGAGGYHLLHGDLFSDAEHGLESALEACESGRDNMQGLLFFLPDMHRFTGKDPAERTDAQHGIIASMQRIAMNKPFGLNNTLIITGSADGMLCPELNDQARIIEIPYPDFDEILSIIMDESTRCGGRANELRPSLANQLADAMRGLREETIRDIIRSAYAMYENPMLDEKSIMSIIHEKKKEQIASIPALSWVNSGQHGKIAGLDMLRSWLEHQCASFMYPLLAGMQLAAPPRGVMVTGLPGTGKTTFACLAAEILMTNKMPLPVISLDPTSLLDSLVGASESNFRMATMAAESIAPAVLVINEFEKFFDRSQNDNTKVSNNLHSLFLDWMERNKRNPVLVIATVNRPELIPEETKSRFNETFFAGVPTAAECMEIARVHLAEYASVLENEKDIDVLAQFFICKAAQYGKYVNGRNIFQICQGAFNEAFGNYAATLTTERRQQLQAMDNSHKHRYTTDEIRNALDAYLKNTSAFFNSNMDMAAAQWVQMRSLEYRNASSREILPESKYHFNEETHRFSGIGPDPKSDGYIEELNRLAQGDGDHMPETIEIALERYDRQLRCSLAARIATLPSRRK